MWLPLVEFCFWYGLLCGFSFQAWCEDCRESVRLTSQFTGWEKQRFLGKAERKTGFLECPLLGITNCVIHSISHLKRNYYLYSTNKSYKDWGTCPKTQLRKCHVFDSTQHFPPSETQTLFYIQCCHPKGSYIKRVKVLIMLKYGWTLKRVS
jgi:hypothetical protein